MPSNNKDYQTKYYQMNRDKLLLNTKELVHCSVCNCDTKKSYITRHNKTVRHLKNIEGEDKVPYKYEKIDGMSRKFIVEEMLIIFKEILPADEYKIVEEKSKLLLVKPKSIEEAEQK
jgi:hypothetical protein